MDNKYFNLYTGFLTKFANIRRPLKIIFDCSNGTVGLTASKLKIKNLELRIINGEPDGNFPAHGPNPTIKGVSDQLQKAVIKNKADLGVIFDADGDRAFFIDNKGRKVDSDKIAYLLIWHFNVKRIMADSVTGWLIKKIVKKEFNVQITESRMGHYFIKKLMRRKKLEFGAERSGHYYFKKFFYLDSGLMTAIEVINAVSKLPYSLADFADLLPVFYNSGEVNFKFFGSKEKLFKTFERKYKKSASRVSYLDGLTMEFGDWPASRSFSEGWWFNLRFSNTEPLLRLNLEAVNPEILKTKLREINGLVENFKS